jgi:hypothetical protein
MFLHFGIDPAEEFRALDCFGAKWSFWEWRRADDEFDSDEMFWKVG